MGDTQEINDKGFFKKLSDGDFGLAKTYWLYGVLVGIVGNILMQGAALSGSKTLIIVLLLVMIVYAVLQLTGVWNASNRYTGLKIWVILAKIAVIIGVLSLLSSVLMVVAM
jgi:hypothetical protein